MRSLDTNSGWYLRGDLGYRLNKVAKAQSASGFTDPSNNKIDSGLMGGIGGGLKSDWFRADVTVDYAAPVKYQGTVVTPGDVTAKVASWTVLANGYFDLGTWYRVTPYVGAGVGGAMVRTSNYTSTVSPPFTTTGATNSQWNLAWAAMAGIAVAISPNMMIDAGYRYLSLGDAKSVSDPNGAMTLKNITAHEVRVGVRWNFEDLPTVR